MALQVENPILLFTDLDGTPLDAGYIFIGQPNMNAIENPIQVYWDAAGIIPATQPIRTLRGYPSNNGIRSNLFVNAPNGFSVIVKDKKATTVFNQPYNDRYSSLVNLINQILASNTTFVTYTYANANYVTYPYASATYAPINSPIFTGDPRAPTPPAGDNDTSIATTAWTRSAIDLAISGMPSGGSGYYAVFAENTQWTKPLGFQSNQLVRIQCWGGGSAGGYAYGAGGDGGDSSFGSHAKAYGSKHIPSQPQCYRGGNYLKAYEDGANYQSAGVRYPVGEARYIFQQDVPGGGTTNFLSLPSGGFWVGAGSGLVGIAGEIGPARAGIGSAWGGGSGGVVVGGSSMYGGSGGTATTAAQVPGGGGGVVAATNDELTNGNGGGGGYWEVYRRLGDLAEIEDVVVGQGGISPSGALFNGARGEVRVTIFA